MAISMEELMEQLVNNGGSDLHLSADLPPGIMMVWDIAESYARPTTTAEPVRFYASIANVIALPAIVIYQSTITLPIPNMPGLIGLEFYAQGIPLPWQNMPYAPDIHFPRGGRLYMRP